MKIGISGVHGSGKTTLLNNEMFRSCTKCDEVTRTVKKEYNVEINEQGNDVTQKLIMREHMANLILNHRMVTDRTVIDCMAYTHYLYDNKQVSKDTLDYISMCYSKLVRKYDLIFYLVPVEDEIADDGVRSTNVEFRDKMIEYFEKYINHFNVVKVKGDYKERIRFCRETLCLF